MTRKYKPKWDNRKVVDWKKIKNMNNKLLLEDLKKSLKYHIKEVKRIKNLISVFNLRKKR